MSTSKQLAKHFRDVFFGGNWTVSNLRDVVKDVTWEQATAKVEGFNTIAKLVFHISYFIAPLKRGLGGMPLDAHDKYSFDVPVIKSQSDWKKLLDNVWSEVESCATKIEQLPDKKLQEDFVEKKYGTYFRNIAGTIEHTHYHLGQIAILKKMVLKGASADPNH